MSFQSYRAPDPGDEAAAAKIWAVYVGEAEKYDKGLVQSWKSDMEGMLIFAGLFSAVLTAFLVESYKTLNRDPEDLTVLLLARISEQIVASVNGSASAIPLPLKFDNDRGPTPAALACNALWFLSLGLSLSCALIATLLEQWAREFLHRTDIYSAPVTRARMFSFLYYGLRRFNLHAIVDVIPLLLHLALLLFFSGLVAFLIPVNTAIAIIAAVMLFVVTTAYSILTVFPLRYLDSPYRTPLTGAFWNLHQYFKMKWHHWRRVQGHTEIAAQSAPRKETMIVALTRAATEVSEDRKSRDLEALTWTVKSLADDTELEPFVDAIPDILWGPEGRRETYYDVFRTLVNNPQITLGSRIVALYKSCETGLLSPTTLKRRRIICIKAIWSIVPFLLSSDLSELSLVNLEKQRKKFISDGETDLEILGFSHSMWALIRWKIFENEQFLLNARINQLEGREPASQILGAMDFKPALSFIRYIDRLWRGFAPDDHPALMNQTRYTLETTPYLNLFDYFRAAITLHTLPYCFHSTLKFIELPKATPATIRYDFDRTFTVAMQYLLQTDNTLELGWRDILVKELLRYWPQQAKTDRIILHPDFLRYLNDRISNEAVSEAMASLAHRAQLWKVFANHLETVSSTALDQKNTLTAMWRLLSLGFYPPPSLVSRFLDACQDLDIPSVPTVLAILKAIYLWHKSLCVTDPANSMHRWLAATSILPTNAESEGINTVANSFSVDRPMIIAPSDPYVVLYAEFLEACARSTETNFPHKAEWTFRFITPLSVLGMELSRVDKTHQIRFASAFRDFFESPSCADLRKSIIEGYFSYRWLDDPIAREIFLAALTQYAEEMSTLAVHYEANVLVQVREILEDLNRTFESESISSGAVFIGHCHRVDFYHSVSVYAESSDIPNSSLDM
ncbi:hypothetical protein R3P38DRAFT_375268 [Favolaschia claudopus]|uniref:DUF6535 domain-containing protein n=1 Tax=Favolaschia claudopus TaxID=2862362 RepID=A0AAV9ZIL5_9AGAR